MSRQQNQAQNFFPGKIRKRGCSSSASSTSSIVQNYRFKRAILIGKRGGGGGSATPVPTWRLMRTTPSSVLRAIDSQSEYGGFVNKAKQHQLQLQQQHQHSQQPVSARKLAATLWEMNEMPSPKLRETSGGGGGYDERRIRREARARERERERVTRSLHSGSLPPHLSDPSHSPVSEVSLILHMFEIFLFYFLEFVGVCIMKLKLLLHVDFASVSMACDVVVCVFFNYFAVGSVVLKVRGTVLFFKFRFVV